MILDDFSFEVFLEPFCFVQDRAPHRPQGQLPIELNVVVVLGVVVRMLNVLLKQRPFCGGLLLLRFLACDRSLNRI